MDASSLSSPLQVYQPFSIRSTRNPKNAHLALLGLRRFHPRCRATGSGGYDRGDWNYGRSVDEEMIVLRKRIHEMRMTERNYEPPLEWMDWEKRYYAHYDADICEAVGLLQNLLMNSRPSLAIGMVVLVALSVPTSVFMVLLHLIQAVKGVF
ncbi:hypothetical protein CKAN_01443300 [Cinnamomum micranthum f. kanehirae]|uniref:Mediator of RNA polymerase II transcription subunit 18 n=1 Tax=Cinnamomum micranthum f. kanehirae TaxID=337451 RepID=A0A443P468_9MAGN|nr:hypothetical protein CKAN_01443300 [Cinnamomum micranthum f. kanehirae]